MRRSPKRKTSARSSRTLKAGSLLSKLKSVFSRKPKEQTPVSISGPMNTVRTGTVQNSILRPNQFGLTNVVRTGLVGPSVVNRPTGSANINESQSHSTFIPTTRKLRDRRRVAMASEYTGSFNLPRDEGDRVRARLQRDLDAFDRHDKIAASGLRSKRKR